MGMQIIGKEIELEGKFYWTTDVNHLIKITVKPSIFVQNKKSDFKNQNLADMRLKF